MKKVLIISYYWPPESGGGVQRILKLCKYLKEFGWEPIILTGIASALEDNSLNKDAHGIKAYRVEYSFNPASLINNKSNKKARLDKNFKWKIMKANMIKFIRINFFIPDSRIGWYAPACKKLNSILACERFDAVLSTGPPYTTHLLGLYLKKRTNLPWVVDVRDPWVENCAYRGVHRFSLIKKINMLLEKKVLERCDRIVTIGEKLANLLDSKIPEVTTDVIFNGYDSDDFRELSQVKIDYFRLGYYGSLNDQRTPRGLIDGLSRAIKKSPEFARFFRWDIFGVASPQALNAITLKIPSQNLRIHGNIQHDDLIKEYSKEQIFLLIIENMSNLDYVVTGKIFEYLHSGWPILGVGPTEGEAAEILRESGSGKMFDHFKTETPVSWLMDHFEKWRKGALKQNRRVNQKYDRRAQARQLSAILDKITS